MAAPMKSHYRGHNDLYEGTIPARPLESDDQRNAAIVLTRISLRPGDNRDILVMLGLVPADVAQ